MTTIAKIETFVLKDSLDKNFSFHSGITAKEISVLLRLLVMMEPMVGEKVMVPQRL